MSIETASYIIQNINKNSKAHNFNDELFSLLEKFTSISLDKLGKVILMNRTDTKFITNFDKLCDLLSLMKNDYFVLSINDNLINPYKTLYLDTNNFKMFTDHHNGHVNRKKVRFRTYLNSDTHFLEVKHKNNKKITKKTRILVDSYDYINNEEAISLITSNTTFKIEDLSPHLENAYNRITLINKEKTERLTIDLNLNFKNHKTDKTGSLDGLVIIELKQDAAKYSLARTFLTSLRIRPTKLSKYCIGSVMTNPNLKYNRFKPKLIQINKTLNNG